MDSYKIIYTSKEMINDYPKLTIITNSPNNNNKHPHILDTYWNHAPAVQTCAKAFRISNNVSQIPQP